ncbi:MAG: MFS transporter [Syntrophomonadaceae bacterium]|nr:MFS transporter [Syntrophomonadaceae bacterium]
MGSERYARKWLTLTIVSLGIFISCMDGSLVNIAAPAIANSLRVPPQTVQWVVTAYLLCITATLLLFGRIGDLIGGRKVYTLGFIIFALGSGLCSTAHTIWTLALYRAFEALGASMLMSTGMGIVTASFPPQQRGQALGTTGIVVALGTLTGPVLGGFIIGNWPWPTIFYLNVFLGTAGFFLARRYLLVDTNLKHIWQEIKSRLTQSGENLSYQLDLPGFSLFATGIVTLLLSLGQAPTWGWANPWTISFGLTGLIFLGAFFRREKTLEMPLLDLGLFQNWTFTGGITTSIMAYMVSFSISFWIPFYLSQVLLLPPQRVGLVMSAIPLTMMITSPTAGWLSDRIGYRILTCLGLCISTLTLLTLSLQEQTVLPLTIALILGIFGIGMSMFNSPNNSSIMGAAPHNKLGIAGGIVATGRNLGMVLGVTLSSVVYTYFYQRYSLLHLNALPSTDYFMVTEMNRQIFAAAVKRVFQAAALISLGGAVISIIRARSVTRDSLIRNTN